MSTLIGTAPDQVPVNGMLGDLAFQNKVSVSIGALTSAGAITITGAFALRGSYGAGAVTSNFAAGDSALVSNTTGNYNSAVGVGALSGNTTGTYNSAMGMNALYSNTTGNQNSAVGMSALYSNTTGTQNSAVGQGTLYSNTTGNYNSAVGVGALRSNTTGTQNSAMGVQALYSNTTGNSNLAVGVNALQDLRPTSKAITAFADYSATVAGTVKATSVAHGLTGTTTKLISGTTNYNASYSVTVIDVDNFYFTATWVATQTGWWSISTEGNTNTALGYNTGRGITTGNGNTIIGASVTGLAAGLTNNIILANGTGSIRVQSNDTTITFADVIMPQQATTAAAPAYVKGGMYFDTTLNKMRIGGATAWETVTSV